MIAQTAQNSISAEKELLVKMVLDAWDTQNSRIDRLLEDLSHNAKTRRRRVAKIISKSFLKIEMITIPKA